MSSQRRGKAMRAPFFSRHAALLPMIVLLSLVGGAPPLADGTPMRASIGGGDAWSYEGEVIVAGGQTCTHIPCNFYCARGVCAHGKGHLGTDGSWWYDGTFVGGQMEGFGRLENDFYVYQGGFKRNKFDGDGVLTCHGGATYRGHFIAGTLSGKAIGWKEPCE